jgi:nucleotide-binding universal stress UspA family protein
MSGWPTSPSAGGAPIGPRRVVVGVAGHAGCVRTLAWAIAESVATGAQLVVVHATGQRRSPAPVPERELVGSMASAASGEGVPRRTMPAPAGGLGARGSLGALETVDRFAAGAVAAARARLGESRVRIVVDADLPGEVLLREAGPRDLLVIGGPPRTGWWVRSGTTTSVVPRARCPVIVVHERYGSGEPEPEEVDTPSGRAGGLLRGHVVVGLDGGGGSVLGYGFAFADSHGLPLVVARVVPHADGHLWFDDGPAGTPSGEPPAAVEVAEQVAPWLRRYPHVAVRRAVLAGDGADALRRASAQAALLVIGAGGTALHPLGVVCRSLVATADCPVAVIH